MSITYDAGTNTIIVTGYSEATPANFTDIYNADVAGGWGVVSLQGVNQFLFECDIYIGDDIITTYFADEKKQLKFASEKKIVFTDNSYTKFGEVVDVAECLGKNGCDFIFDVTSPSRKCFVQSDGAEVQAYSTRFTNLNIGWDAGFNINIDPTKTNRFWNCDLEGVFYTIIEGSSTSGTIFANTNFNNQNFGIAVSGIWNIDAFKNVVAHEMTKGFYLVSVNGLTLAGMTFKEISGVTFGLNGCTGDFNFINFDCDWIFEWSNSPTMTANRQNTFNLKVTDKDGNNINGASVKIWDKDDNLVVDTTTASGIIAEQTITRGYYNQANGNTLQEASPHTIQISKAGYQTYSKKFTLDSKIDWMIRLKRSVVNIDQEVIL